MTDVNESRSGAISLSKNMSAVNLKGYGGVGQSQDFVAGSTTESNNEIVNMVLKKSEFWEDRLIAKGYKNEVKNILVENRGNDDFSMSKLKDCFGE